jgi:hypothetical protein
MWMPATLLVATWRTSPVVVLVRNCLSFLLCLSSSLFSSYVISSILLSSYLLHYFPHVWSKVEPKSSIFVVRILIFGEMKRNTHTLYFHGHNPSGRTMVLGSTQRLTEMSTKNISWGVKVAGALGWQPYHPPAPIVLKSGSLNLPEPSWPVQGCTGIALPVPCTFTRTVYGPDIIKIKMRYCLLKPCFFTFWSKRILFIRGNFALIQGVVCGLG